MSVLISKTLAVLVGMGFLRGPPNTPPATRRLHDVLLNYNAWTVRGDVLMAPLAARAGPLRRPLSCLLEGTRDRGDDAKAMNWSTLCRGNGRQLGYTCPTSSPSASGMVAAKAKCARTRRPLMLAVAMRNQVAVAAQRPQFEGGISRLGRGAVRSRSCVARTVVTSLPKFVGPIEGLGAPLELRTAGRKPDWTPGMPTYRCLLRCTLSGYKGAARGTRPPLRCPRRWSGWPR